MNVIRHIPPGRAFRFVLWIGIAVNLMLSACVLWDPAATLARFNLPPAEPLMWPRFAALLLVLLSVFYMPAGVDPDRYRANAWMAVGARLVGVTFFFLFQPPVYRMLGMVDLVFFVPEAILLTMAVRSPAAAAAARSVGTL